MFNILLQILDDGRVTDSQGRTVDFKNTVIILTSNIGSQDIIEGIEDGEISAEARERVNVLLRKTFRPEFLNRLDEIIMFKPLTGENIKGIVNILIARLQKRLEQKNLTLEVTEAARSYISENGCDNVYGARPLKRFIQSRVETPIANFIIKNNPEAGAHITLDCGNDGLYLKGGEN